MYLNEAVTDNNAISIYYCFGYFVTTMLSRSRECCLYSDLGLLSRGRCGIGCFGSAVTGYGDHCKNLGVTLVSRGWIFSVGSMAHFVILWIKFIADTTLSDRILEISKIVQAG